MKQNPLHFVSILILLIGLCSAGVIYLTAAGAPADPMAFTADSKMYRHNLELYGGKMNLLANDLVEGFLGLWRGKTLAYTIAFLSAVVSLALYVFAGIRTSESPSAGENRDNRPSPE